MTSRRWSQLAGGWFLAFGVGIVIALQLQSRGDWNQGLEWERELLRSMHVTLPSALDTLLLIVPWFGTNITLLPLVIAAAIVLFWRAHRREMALQLVVANVGGWLLTFALKIMFERARPELWEHRGQFAHAAFPSGHAIASIAVLFTVATLLRRELGWRWPYLAAALLLSISLYSRLYLGVHWPTDVIAGVLVGSVWLAVTLRTFGEPRG
ncbi:MAG: phosphatase PAP2 family protein [Gemmatimonadaceae bacterium]